MSAAPCEADVNGVRGVREVLGAVCMEAKLSLFISKQHLMKLYLLWGHLSYNSAESSGCSTELRWQFHLQVALCPPHYKAACKAV